MRSFDVPALESEELNEAYLKSLDCALIATDHSRFDYDAIVKHSPLVVDTRNATKCVTGEKANVWKA